MSTVCLTPQAVADVRELAAQLSVSEGAAIHAAVRAALLLRFVTLGFGGLSAGQGRPPA